MRSLEAIWLRRAEEQAYSAATDAEIRAPKVSGPSRSPVRCFCGRQLARRNQTGICRLCNKGPANRLAIARRLARMQGQMALIPQRPLPQRNGTPSPAKQFQAYTLARRKDGWVILTVLVSETDVVDESDTDVKAAQMGHLMSKLVRME